VTAADVRQQAIDALSEVRALLLNGEDKRKPMLGSEIAIVVDALIAQGVIRETDNTGDDDYETAARIAEGTLTSSRLTDPSDEDLAADARTRLIAERIRNSSVARSSGVADTPKDLDPNPWTWGDAETPVGHVRQSWSDHWHKGFAPRPEFEQDESKYPHMQGVADTPPTDEQIAEDNADWHREIPEGDHLRLTHAELLISEVETAVDEGTFGQTAWWRRRAVGLAKELKARLVEGVADTVKEDGK
jgi:hypothetical protein